MEVNFYEYTGGMVARMQWTPPGASGVSNIPAEYMVPSMTAEVLVTTHDTITVSGKPEIEFFEARLLEKPTEIVYVDIFNLAGGDIFDVDKCVLVLTPENWETPQYFINLDGDHRFGDSTSTLSPLKLTISLCREQPC
ncbi:hypothetical protein SARC_05760 [Sphaeroforma arctica JP610]|uniref:Uncharacterized protein n=1 Tax=Sphaeroforma arctica JP610 TaxID=667725 RepID=A0A0L0FYM3_9EUKA|nr:hypothetical protein SARC_05760 [Sphaeroforma arctica JP610]KNC81947.1 hypothetical protein SARC_05760 [Sphaeroforma arctica JP610]|eukprot:XP_014155849.1 hypothetical protein SARC_05760 [Sphaeroforma arctica JP610]